MSASKKHDLSGIGKASALLTMKLLAASPLAPLTGGFGGKITYWFLTWMYTRLASVGLVVLNVGAAAVQTLAEKEEFDGSFDDAFKIINERKGILTDEETKSIDDKVIRAFRRITDFGVRDSRNP